MIYNLLAWFLQTSPITIRFVLDPKSGYIKKLWLIIPFAIWGSLLGIVTPLFLKTQVDTLTTFVEKGYPQSEFNNVLYNIIIVLAVITGIKIFDNLIRLIRDMMMRKINYYSTIYIEDKVTNHLKQFDSPFLGADNNLRIIHGIRGEIQSMESKILSLFDSMVRIPTFIFSLLIVLTLLHPYLIILVIIDGVINMLFQSYSSIVWRRRELMVRRLDDKKWQHQYIAFWQMPMLLMNGWFDNVYKRYQTSRQLHFDTTYKQDQADSYIGFGRNLFAELLTGSMSVVAAWLTLTRAITLGTFTVFFSYAGQLQSFMNMISDTARTVVDLRYSLYQIEYILLIKPRFDKSNILDFKDNNINSIMLNNVIYKYPTFYGEEKDYFERLSKKVGLLTDNTKPKNWLDKINKSIIKSNIGSWHQKDLENNMKELSKLFESSKDRGNILKGVSHTFKKGTLTAVVGYNGAGKSTLMKILKRGIDPIQGSVIINNTPLLTIDPLLWKNSLAALEQTSVIINSYTLRENLVINARDVITDEKIKTALERVGLGEYKDRLDDVISEGIELSGGQYQLLELARIILSPRPLIILDEGTNQLDAMKEANVVQIIKELSKDSIIIFITHRMTTARMCDEVIILEEGIIKETGKPNELLAAKEDNLFKKFWSIQVEGV
jgi:ABC-type multidrug transport system fused ATPase/permease subunit